MLQTSHQLNLHRAHRRQAYSSPPRAPRSSSQERFRCRTARPARARPERLGPTSVGRRAAAYAFLLGSLWAAVPHYVAAVPNPKAALALLRRLALKFLNFLTHDQRAVNAALVQAVQKHSRKLRE